MIIEGLRRCVVLLAASGATHGVVGLDARPLEALSIPNIHVVAPGIIRGGRPRAKSDIRSMAHRGIKTIVNLQGRDFRPGLARSIRVYQPGERRGAVEAERALSESLGISYVHLPFNSMMPVSDDDAANILQAVAVLADPNNHPVFIHCEHGRDRTGLIVALHRVLNMGWSPERAMAEWVQHGHAGWLTLKFTGNLDVHFARVLKAAGHDFNLASPLQTQ